MLPSVENQQLIPGAGPDLFALFRALFGAGAEGTGTDALSATLSNIWSIYALLAFIFSGLCILGILYAYHRENQIMQKLSEELEEAHRLWHELNEKTPQNQRWTSVEEHLVSSNPNDWKLAIIEADIMLDEALDKAGYDGGSVGERLKGTSRHSFRTLDEAWSAHRVRNQIAHEGADFVLTHRLAKETIAHYKHVLEELRAI